MKPSSREAKPQWKTIGRTTCALSWPTKGDRLFGLRPRYDGRDDALVNWSPGNWDLYASGYKRGADQLIETALAQGSLDVLVYPIVFLYRQYLELRLKEIHSAASELLDRDSPSLHGHRLDGLWKSVRPLVEEVFDGADIGPLDAIGALFHEFARIDPKSDGFRYPLDTGGEPTLPGLTSINLRRLQHVVDRMANLLDGISMGISAHLSHKSDMMLAHSRY